MTTPPRPDQQIDPPAQVIAPGGSAGIFRGRLIIVIGSSAPPGSGIFVYNNAAALIGSWVGAAGTDPIDGQAVQLGFTVQSPGGTIQANMQSGALTIEKFSGVLAPPQISLLDDTKTAGTASNTTINTAGIVTPVVQAVTPGDNTGGAETWHSLGTLASYSIDVARYKVSAENELLLQIQVTSAGANAGSTTFSNTLPAAYIPASTPAGGLRLPLAQTRAITAADTFPRVFIAQSGAVQIVQTAAVNNTLGTSLSVPLD